jgi:hypothetical protein
MITRTKDRAEAVKAEALPADLCVSGRRRRDAMSKTKVAANDSGESMPSTSGETLVSYWELPSYWE